VGKKAVTRSIRKKLEQGTGARSWREKLEQETDRAARVRSSNTVEQEGVAKSWSVILEKEAETRDQNAGEKEPWQDARA